MNSCPHSGHPRAKNKLGKVSKEEGEDNTCVKGVKLYNQSSFKPFGLGSPNQLLTALYLLMQLFLMLKVTLSIPHSTNKQVFAGRITAL